MTRVSIPVARPWLGEPEADAARRAILSGWVTQGPEVRAFEEEFAVAVGAPHACAVSSCTAALHLALLACGVGAGDEVITVSYSFIATANAIRYCGATPVFVDVERDSCNIDPVAIERAITPRTKAILVVHQFGMPCDLMAITAAAKLRAIPVIEDAACAAGSEIRSRDRWERIGRPHGLIACFSFHPRKLLSTGDGGMLTTADPSLDRQFRLLRQHGMTVSDLARHESATVVCESYSTLGFNYRMTDIQAAIGREQIKRLGDMVARRRALAGRYTSALADCAGLTLSVEPQWARTNWQSYTVRVAPEQQGQIMQRMLDAGIATRRGAMNAHLERAYEPSGWRAATPLTHSEQALESVIVLPLFHDLTERDQDTVIGELRRACGDLS